MVLPEIKQLLTKKQIERFGVFISIVTIVAVAGYIVKGIFEIRTLHQTYKINKYTLDDLKNQSNAKPVK